jgi:dTMP kinase
MKGKFIVIEGTDGAGCGAQTESLKEKLNTRLPQPVLHLKYPNYNNPIGSTIHEFLHGKFKFDTKIQFLLYALDMLNDMNEIKNALEKGRIVLADRYFTSTIAFQCAEGFPLEKALKFADIFEMIKPDLIFYLKVSAETSMQRKKKEKTDLDIFEKDLQFRRKVSSQYDYLSKNNVFGKWITVDAEKSIEEVSNQIFDIVKKELRI